VTATPFANVFINPDTENDMIGDDLFPRDFIYSLEAPNNYLGPYAVFEEGRGSFLKHFDDAEERIPLIHKVDFTPYELPTSLLEALRSFVLTTTIRDLRGEGPTHRSMLVNVSRFTNVQDRIALLIDAGVAGPATRSSAVCKLFPEEACAQSPRIAALREFWIRDCDATQLQWDTIQSSLHAAIQPISVKTVNQRSGAAALDYKINKETGLRVITVGGNSLSRGLTLEG